MVCGQGLGGWGQVWKKLRTGIREVLANQSIPLECCTSVSVCLDIAAGKFSSGGCKLSLLQKDLKLAINMSDAVDQPLHVSSAVNEVCWLLFVSFTKWA